MRLHFFLPAALLLATATFVAHADTFAFASSAGSFSFSLPNSPTPSFVSAGEGFQLDYVSAAVPSGGIQTINVAFFDANASPKSGGFGFQGTMSSTSYIFFGPQVFGGTDANPTFLTGIYNLTDQAGTIHDATLTIADPSVSSVPEPSTLVLLGSGIFGLAGIARRKFLLS